MSKSGNCVSNQTFVCVLYRENADPGSLVVDLAATDADAEETTQLTYRLEELVKDYFDVTDGGQVVTRSKLDREEKPFYSFYVTVSDSGDPKTALTTKCLVEVAVEDENDQV